LTTLAADAEVYASMDKFPDNSVEGRFHYRVIRALDSNVISPFLLWILNGTQIECRASNAPKPLPP